MGVRGEEWGRGMGRERDSGIWVRGIEVNSRNKCRRKMRKQTGDRSKWARQKDRREG